MSRAPIDEDPFIRDLIYGAAEPETLVRRQRGLARTRALRRRMAERARENLAGRQRTDLGVPMGRDPLTGAPRGLLSPTAEVAIETGLRGGQFAVDPLGELLAAGTMGAERAGVPGAGVMLPLAALLSALKGSPGASKRLLQSGEKALGPIARLLGRKVDDVAKMNGDDLIRALDDAAAKAPRAQTMVTPQEVEAMSVASAPARRAARRGRRPRKRKPSVEEKVEEAGDVMAETPVTAAEAAKQPGRVRRGLGAAYKVGAAGVTGLFGLSLLSDLLEGEGEPPTGREEQAAAARAEQVQEEMRTGSWALEQFINKARVLDDEISALPATEDELKRAQLMALIAEQSQPPTREELRGLTEAMIRHRANIQAIDAQIDELTANAEAKPGTVAGDMRIFFESMGRTFGESGPLPLPPGAVSTSTDDERRAMAAAMTGTRLVQPAAASRAEPAGGETD